MRVLQRRVASVLAVCGAALLASAAQLAAQAQTAPTQSVCYVLDEQFARQFDVTVIIYALTATLVFPIFAGALAGRFWWAAQPFLRWGIVVGVLFLLFLALWIGLPVLALLGYITPELGLRFHFGLSPVYLQCASTIFASRGFMFSLFPTGQAMSLASWMTMIAVTGILFILFSAVYWGGTMLVNRRRWS